MSAGQVMPPWHRRGPVSDDEFRAPMYDDQPEIAPCQKCGASAAAVTLFPSPPYGATFVKCLGVVSHYGPRGQYQWAIRAWNVGS